MNLITGIISVIVLIGTIAYLPNKNSGFMTTLFFFAGLLSGIMSLADNWNWWWTVPLVFVGLYLIIMVVVQIRSMTNAAAFLNKFIPLNTLLSIFLMLTSVVPFLKTNLAPNLSTAISASLLWPVSVIMLLIAIGVGLGGGNWILGMLTIGEAIKNFFLFLWNNKAKSLVTLLGLIYAIIYFSYSIPQIYQWVTGSVPTSNMTMWVLNLITLGLAIVLGVAFLSATMTKFPNSMSFWTRFKQLFTGSLSMTIFKILGVILLVGALIYGLVQLGLVKFPHIVGNIVTITVQIICAIAILAAIFRFVIGNPRLLAEIKNNIFVQLLFTIIMVIPCAIIYLVQALMASGKAAGKAAGKGASFMAKVKAVAPPKMVLSVLAAEIVIVSTYILLPMFRKWIYTLNFGGDGDIVLQQRVAGAQNAILSSQKNYEKAISIGSTPLSDIDWQKVYSEKMYLTDSDAHKKALKEYLTSLGYQETYGEIRDNLVVSKVLGNPVTIAQAISFIQTKGRVEGIIDKLLAIENLQDKVKALEKQSSDDGPGPFDSKILNNKPTYINKQTNIGVYENLKGGADDYNYNYGLSSWIFLMAQPPNFGVGYSKFTKVLDYAGKPTIWYNPEINTFKITVKAYKKGTRTPYNKTVYTTKKLPLQRWNNVIVNYVGGTLDVFINKDLVASVKNVIPYMSSDAIYIGDKYGISGAVANVTYFSQPISTGRITFFYENLVNKDPPII
jgi:hypothetical protein